MARLGPDRRRGVRMPDCPNCLVVEDDGEKRAEIVQLAVAYGFRPLQAANTAEAQALLEKGLDWRAFVFDVGLPDGSGLHVLAFARARYGWTPALILTGIRDVDVGNAAYDLNARCAWKNDDDMSRVEAFFKVAIACPPTLDPLWVGSQRWGHRYGFSTAEKDVFFRTAEGATEAEIAVERGSTLKTVESHARSICFKTGDRSLKEAVLRFIREEIRADWRPPAPPGVERRAP
jgi:DNA-binding NarL/FixJ family response regulator